MRKLGRNSHISSLLDDGLEVDKLMGGASRILYGLETDQLNILSILARKGSCNFSELEEEGLHYDIDRFLARRRINGTNRQHGLRELDFIIQKEGMAHRYNKKEQRLSLSLKGLIASTAVVPFERNYLVRHFCKFIERWSLGNALVADSFIQCMKYNLALFTYSHAINGLGLTHQKDTVPYFLSWNESSALLGQVYSYPSGAMNPDEVASLRGIRHKFYTSRLLFSIALKIANSHTYHSVSLGEDFDLLKKKGHEYGDFVWKYLHDWVWYIDRMQFEDPDSYNPNVAQYNDDDLFTNFEIYGDNVRKEAKNILKAIGIKSGDLRWTPLMWDS